MNKQQLQAELDKVTKEYKASLNLARTEDNYQYSTKLLKQKQQIERQLRGLN